MSIQEEPIRHFERPGKRVLDLRKLGVPFVPVLSVSNPPKAMPGAEGAALVGTGCVRDGDGLCASLLLVPAFRQAFQTRDGKFTVGMEKMKMNISSGILRLLMVLPLAALSATPTAQIVDIPNRTLSSVDYATFSAKLAKMDLVPRTGGVR